MTSLGVIKGCVVVERHHRIQMALGQIEDVDVVSHTRAIGRWVVVAKHLETRLTVLADGHLCQQRQQVTRLAAGVFSHAA